MRRNKIGAMFLVSTLALAGIGISYAGFTDYLQVYGRITTADMSIEIVNYSGTIVWKVWDCQNDPAAKPPVDEIHIWRGNMINAPSDAMIQALYPLCCITPINSFRFF